MVASQVLIAVCTISFAVAAPQVGSRRTVTTVSQGVSSNPDQIVSSVLSSLQQPIAIAVAEALNGLKTSRTVSTTGSSGLGAGLFISTGGAGTGTGGARFGGSSGSSKFLTSGSSGASLGSSLASKGASVTGAPLGSSFTSSGAVGVSQSSSDDIFVRPEYKFEFKVSDDGAQTYISQNEERDGDAVSGSYSYIDANGALVTVNYQAGDMGYTETREIQDGVVQIRPIIYQEEQVSSSAQIAAAQNAAAQNAAAAQRAAAERNAAAQRAASERAAAAAQREASQRAAIARAAAAAQRKAASDRAAAAAQRAAAERASAETSSFNSAALISQIISALEPQIGTAVQNALGSSSSSSTITTLVPVTTSSAIQAIPSSSSSSSQSSGLSSSSSQSSGLSSSSRQSSGLSSSSSQASGLSSLFGNGGNVVRIATPKFQVEY